MKSLIRIRGLAVLVLLVFDGCQTRPAIQGMSTFEILERQRAIHQTSASDEQSDIEIVYIPRHPKKALAKPVYPAKALADQAGHYVVYATITVDDSGHVINVSHSLRDFALPNSFSSDFFKSVQDAATSWDFYPSRYVYWQHEPDGEKKYLRTEFLTEQMEVKFTFEASGVVQ